MHEDEFMRHRAIGRRRNSSATAAFALLALSMTAAPTSAQGALPPQGVQPALTQAVVPPTDARRYRGQTWGAAWLQGPCGVSLIKEYQHLFPTPPGMLTVRAVAMRRHDDTPTTASVQAFSVTVEMWMGHSPSTSGLYRYTFAGNRGPDFTKVLPLQTISFPAQPPVPNNNYPFIYRFPLSTPFTLQPGRTGLIEWHLVDSTLCIGTSPGRQETFYGPVAPGATITSFGTNCDPYGADGNRVDTTYMSVGNSAEAIMVPTRVIANGSRGLIYGGMDAKSWNGLPLPFSLAPYGAPGCSLYIDFGWAWPLTYTPVPGDFLWATLDVPADPSLAGQTVYVQGVRFDRLLNALGLGTSNGVRLTIGGHITPPISTLSGPDGPPGSGGGWPELGNGPVFLLDGQ